jgi:hypothetical protein
MDMRDERKLGCAVILGVVSRGDCPVRDSVEIFFDLPRADLPADWTGNGDAAIGDWRAARTLRGYVPDVEEGVVAGGGYYATGFTGGTVQGGTDLFF